MENNIIIEEKPDWVSWDEIHNVLFRAHAFNRANGIIMRKPSLQGEEIKKEIGKNGIMLVALDNNVIIGTAALLPKSSSTWYNEGPYGYCCFDAVVPEYNGRGVYKQLCIKREDIARNIGLNKLFIDTHCKNTRVIRLNLKIGFKRVGVKNCGNHRNVVLFKWLDGCPYSELTCKWHYSILLLKYHLYRFIHLLFG